MALPAGRMESRHQQLSELRSYITRVDKEVTLALQTLQWDTNRLLDDASRGQSPKRAVERCSTRPEGYEDTELLLPETVHDYGTVVKLSPSDVSQIIKAAAESDSTFKMGGTDPALRPTPQSYDRLLSTFTSDERRAIYDAVVSRANPAEALQDLTLPCDNSDNTTRPKSKIEILAELRDMKRRRTKYKVATKSKNYSQVLREVIKNEMEIYTGIKQEPEEYNSCNNPVARTSTHPLRQEHLSPERQSTSNGSVPTTSEYTLREIKREPSSPPLDNHRKNEAKTYNRQSKSQDYYTKDRSKEHHRSEMRNYDSQYESRDRHRQDSTREHRHYNTTQLNRVHRKDHDYRDYRRDESRSNKKHKRRQSKHDDDYERDSRSRVTPPNDRDSYDGRKKIKTEDSPSREIVNDSHHRSRNSREKYHRESDERVRIHKHKRYDSKYYDKHVKEEYIESDSHSTKEDRHKSQTQHRSHREGTWDKK